MAKKKMGGLSLATLARKGKQRKEESEPSAWIVVGWDRRSNSRGRENFWR